jgi:transcriptional regulator with XRE-family HTH domain
MQENLGSRMRRIRKEQKLPLRAVADKTDISVAYLSKIERNEANPTVEILQRLARVYKMTLNELSIGIEARSEVIDEDMPDSLRKFITDYKDKFPNLSEPDWQRMLLGVRLRGRYPERSDDWLMIFLEAKRAFE